VLLAPLVVLCPYAWASWKFVSTGTATVVGTPSCAQLSTSHVVCAARNGKSAMLVNEFSGAAWHAWTTLTGAITSNPSCSGDGNGNVICAATATTNQLQ